MMQFLHIGGPLDGKFIEANCEQKLNYEQDIYHLERLECCCYSVFFYRHTSVDLSSLAATIINNYKRN